MKARTAGGKPGYRQPLLLGGLEKVGVRDPVSRFETAD